MITNFKTWTREITTIVVDSLIQVDYGAKLSQGKTVKFRRGPAAVTENERSNYPV